MTPRSDVLLSLLCPHELYPILPFRPWTMARHDVMSTWHWALDYGTAWHGTEPWTMARHDMAL